MNRRRYFNEAAECWDHRFITPELKIFLRELVPAFGLEQGQRVLDVGTGTGVLIPFLVQVVGSHGSVVAIDYSEKMIQICRRKYSNLQNVTIELRDAKRLDFPSEYFDAVTCFGLFPHLEHREKTLLELNRVLRLNGRFVIAHALGRDEIMNHHRKESSVVYNDVLPDEHEMRRLLYQANFNEIYINDVPDCYLCLSNKTLKV